MKIKTQDLTGHALDWAVAKAENLDVYLDDGIVCLKGQPFDDVSPYWLPTKNWAQGGPIIEREGLCVQPYCSLYEYKPILEWESFVMARCFENEHPRGIGPTPLIAAMRCFVASRLGDEVDVPDELVEAAYA